MDMKATRAPRTSVIGVRAAWTCCVCRAQETTYQIISATDLTLDLPKGWTQRDGRTYCADAAPLSGLLKERTH